MNRLLHRYYFPLMKTSGALTPVQDDLLLLREVHALRSLSPERKLQAVSPAAEADLYARLGGEKAAVQKLSAVAAWMAAWDAGERQARQLVEAGVLAVLRQENRTL